MVISSPQTFIRGATNVKTYEAGDCKRYRAHHLCHTKPWKDQQTGLYFSSVHGDTSHLLVRILLVLLDVSDGLGAQPVGDLVGAQGDAEDVLVVAVLILVAGEGGREGGRRVRKDESLLL